MVESVIGVKSAWFRWRQIIFELVLSSLYSIVILSGLWAFSTPLTVTADIYITVLFVQHYKREVLKDSYSYWCKWCPPAMLIMNPKRRQTVRRKFCSRLWKFLDLFYFFIFSLFHWDCFLMDSRFLGQFQIILAGNRDRSEIL